MSSQISAVKVDSLAAIAIALIVLVGMAPLTVRVCRKWHSVLRLVLVKSIS